jgi:predicted short-subunit dehydrogenase-like oxidoreductase (DUF2520 family)
LGGSFLEKKEIVMTRVAVVGAGRLGTTLGAAMASKGFDVAAVSCRNRPSARESARLIGGARATTSPARAAASADVVFLCLPDDALAPQVRKLASTLSDWKGKTVFHTSGILAADVLAPLKAKGALTASFHPAQTFPRKDAAPGSFRGVAFVMEGDAAAVDLGRRIARRLGGRILTLQPKHKALYHAACHLASGGMTSLLDAAAFLLQEAGFNPRQAADILFPLAERTLQNVKKIGPRKALTGPVVRGDIRTVEAHLAALVREPGIRNLYVGLALRGLDRTAKAQLPVRTVRALMHLLEDK